jgi:hypothetical protein
LPAGSPRGPGPWLETSSEGRTQIMSSGRERRTEMISDFGEEAVKNAIPSERVKKEKG